MSCVQAFVIIINQNYPHIQAPTVMVSFVLDVKGVLAREC